MRRLPYQQLKCCRTCLCSMPDLVSTFRSPLYCVPFNCDPSVCCSVPPRSAPAVCRLHFVMCCSSLSGRHLLVSVLVVGVDFQMTVFQFSAAQKCKIQMSGEQQDNNPESKLDHGYCSTLKGEYLIHSQLFPSLFYCITVRQRFHQFWQRGRLPSNIVTGLTQPGPRSAGCGCVRLASY